MPPFSYSQTLGNLLRAARSNPAARPCVIWQPATTGTDTGIILDGTFQFERVGEGFAVYSFGQPDEWNGPMGDYQGSFKINVIMKPKTLGETDQPSLARSFLVQNLTQGFDPFPKWALVENLETMASNGLMATYKAREMTPEEVAAIQQLGEGAPPADP